MHGAAGVVICLVIFDCFIAVLPAVSIKPADDKVFFDVGGSVRLTCTTTNGNYTVAWQYQLTSTSRPYNIFRSGFVINGFRNRTRAHLDVPNEYTIEIQSMTSSDAGVYTCIDKGGLSPDRVSVRLELNTEHASTTESSVVLSTDQAIDDKLFSSDVTQDPVAITVITIAAITVTVVVVGLLVVVTIKRSKQGYTPSWTKKVIEHSATYGEIMSQGEFNQPAF